MTHKMSSSLSMKNKEALKLLTFLYNQNRHFKTSVSAFCAASEKSLSPHSPPVFKSEISSAPATPTESKQYTHASQYEPTLIASPSITANKPRNASTTPLPVQASFGSKTGMSSDHVLNSVLNEVDPSTVGRVYYFDSLALSKKLESKGFTRDQAEGCVESLLEIIGATLEHQAKHMITKAEQKITEQQLKTEIMSVKKDMVLLQKSEFSTLRTETEKISIDIAQIQSHFQDEVVKLKGQFTLDVNLERGRAVEAHAASEKNLQMLNNKIETEIAHLKTTYEVYRNDIFKYAAGTVLTCTTLIIGFIRLWK